MKLATAFALVALSPMTAFALPTPKPTPVPSGTFCVNRTTGTVRNALDKNGIIAPCHPAEITTTLGALVAAPTASPTLGAPAPTPSAGASADPSATATPSAGNGPMVVDANGNLVGFDPENSDIGDNSATVVAREIGTVWVDFLVGSNGFADAATTGNYQAPTFYYTSTDCSGQAFLVVANGPTVNMTAPFEPLVQGVDVGSGGTYVYNQVLYYANQPFQTITPQSAQTFRDPAAPATEGCFNPDGTNPPQNLSFVAGPVTSFDLSTLNLTPPFSISE